MSPKFLTSMSLFGVVTALSLAPSQVRAQTTANISIVTGTQATQLVDANKNPVTHGFVSDQPFWVNLAECRAGWQYQVSVTTVGIGSTTVEVWAGPTSADCTQTSYRFGTAPSCWRVGLFGINDGTNAFYIPVQNVVAGKTMDSSHSGSTDVPVTSEADCTRVAQSNTQEAGVAINLNFYIFSGGTANGAPTYTATWSSAGYDLVGPAPPTTVGLKSADSQMYVNWSQVAVTDLAGYKIYCQDAAALDGGITVDADASATDAGTGDCPDEPTTLIPGCLPPNDPSLLKGTISDKLATSGVAQNLGNGTQYACAVASFDTRQNDGVLSGLQFSTPWYVDDFYSKYRAAGGKAGGGFCSISRHGWPVSSALIFAWTALLALHLRRRSSR